MLQATNPSSRLARSLAWALVFAGILGGVGWVWWNCVRRPDVSFLPQRAPAKWILYPSGPKVMIYPRLETETLFQRSFALDRVPTNARLSVAGLYQYKLSINGKPVTAPTRQGRNWKQPDQFEVAQALRAGENEIAVTVSNSNGPPVLWLSLDAGVLQLNSDETWQASCGGAARRQACLASKPKVAIMGSPICEGERPWISLCAQWPSVLLFAALSVVACWVIGRYFLPSGNHSARNTPHDAAHTRSRELLPVILLAALWVVLFANNLGVLPSLVGYDVDGHIAYIHYIQEHHCLPRADEGWEMFQPPLYYLLGAGLLSALSLSATQDGGILALRIMGLVIGIVHFVLVWASLRLLFPSEQSKPKWGLLLAACLPPMLYLSQYVSNEGLAAALVSASVYLTLRMLKQERLSWTTCAGLGVCLGASLLTKSTALLAVPAVLGALLWKELQGRWSIVRDPWFALGTKGDWRLWGQVGAVLGICGLICGWHYARLWMQYGSPLIGVWDPRLGFSWWQDDGYRTSAFYLRFGSVLAHPWFSSFKSFGDGIYATLWGDGLFGGAADAVARPPWNYDLMAVGYWLALVPTLAIVVGGIFLLMGFLRRPSAEGFLVLGLAFLAALALVHMSVVLPYQCHVKAFYALCALVPLCAFGACGFSALCRWSGKLQWALWVLFGVWAINGYAALWILRSAEATLLSRTQSLWKEGRRPAALELLKAGLDKEPSPSPDAQAFLAYLLLETGDALAAGNLAEDAVRRGPDGAKGHLVLAACLRRQQRFDEATEHARRAVRLAPADSSAYEQLVSLLLAGHEHMDEAIQIAREGLAVAPFSPELHFSLGTALALRGETAEGVFQLHLASRIKPNWAGPHFMLGTTLLRQRKLTEATQYLQAAVLLEPGDAATHCELATALNAQGLTTEAITHYTEALRLEPAYAEALNDLAWIRAAHAQAAFRDGAEAVRLAERACKAAEYKEPIMVGTLAAAYAEAGRFEDAAETARKARKLALAAGLQELAQKNQELVELFKARRPYREPTQP